jgi:hypothetical protein
MGDDDGDSCDGIDSHGGVKKIEDVCSYHRNLGHFRDVATAYLGVT